MSRIRYLKPDFFIDEDIAELPYEVRLFFQGLWCSADKAGRLEDRPKKLKVQILPYDNVDVEKMLNLLVKPKNGNRRPFIIRYEIENEKYIQIVNWNKHQKPHHTEKDSIIPLYKKKESNIKKETKIKIKGMGKIKQINASSELKNGYLTVKVKASLKKGELPFLKDEKFCQTFRDYLNMRKENGFKTTDRAIELRLKDLHNHGYDIKTAIAMLEESIMNSWQGVFPLKDKQNQTQGGGYGKSRSHAKKYREDRTI